MNVGQDKEAVAKNMSEAIAMCYGGVDAFLFVTKYGNSFTPQDTAALEDLKKIFGDKFMEHMIVVVTCGDHFHDRMEEEGRSISFADWCREQRGAFQKL
jgi:GTPase Era involved in 16S rRNA processing